MPTLPWPRVTVRWLLRLGCGPELERVMLIICKDIEDACNVARALRKRYDQTHRVLAADDGYIVRLYQDVF